MKNIILLIILFNTFSAFASNCHKVIELNQHEQFFTACMSYSSEKNFLDYVLIQQHLDNPRKLEHSFGSVTQPSNEFEALQKKAQSGNSHAQFHFGVVLQYALEASHMKKYNSDPKSTYATTPNSSESKHLVSLKKKEAIVWYEKSAKQENTAATIVSAIVLSAYNPCNPEDINRAIKYAKTIEDQGIIRNFSTIIKLNHAEHKILITNSFGDDEYYMELFCKEIKDVSE